MGEIPPIPTQPLFLAPTTPQEVEAAESGRCELAGCEAPLPHSPGNEGKVRYCSPQHRREARARRSRARHGDAR